MGGSLIVGPAWIGDMVMAHTLVQNISAASPSQPVEMLAPPATAAIAGRMNEVSRVHVLEAAHGELGLAKRFRMGRKLSAQDFSRSYVLPNSWKSALVPYFARIPRRSGWLGEARYGLLNDKSALPEDDLPLMIERFMGLQEIGTSLQKPYPQPKLAVDSERQTTLFSELMLMQSSRAIALCPGAEFGEAKRWPAEHFAEIGAQALEQGLEVWLLGGPADREVCDRIAGAMSAKGAGLAKQGFANPAGQIKNIAGQTSLTDVIDLLAAASAAVCNDSGLMHVACAVDTPVIALYGSTSPGFTPPLHPEARALTLVEIDGGAKKLSCQPCFERTCRYDHGNCLSELAPEHVSRRLKTLGIFHGAQAS